MTDFKKLSSVIARSGMRMKSVAEMSGMTYPTFHNRFRGIGEFSANEINSLSRTLHLTKNEREEIFFAVDVE